MQQTKTRARAPRCESGEWSGEVCAAPLRSKRVTVSFVRDQHRSTVAALNADDRWARVRLSVCIDCAEWMLEHDSSACKVPY
jgi:hypothetical protein